MKSCCSLRKLPRVEAAPEEAAAEAAPEELWKNLLRLRLLRKKPSRLKLLLKRKPLKAEPLLLLRLLQKRPRPLPLKKPAAEAAPEEDAADAAAEEAPKKADAAERR